MPEYLNVTTRGGTLTGTNNEFTLNFRGLNIDPNAQYTVKVIEFEYPNNPTYTNDVRPIILCDQSAPIFDNIFTRQILFKSPFESGNANRIYCNETNSPMIIRPLINNSFQSISFQIDKSDGTGLYDMTDFIALLLQFDEVF